MVTICWSVYLSEVTKGNDPLNGLLNVYVSYLEYFEYHGPLPGTFLLHTWSFVFQGMPRISFLQRPALTGVVGTFDGPVSLL